MTIPAHIAKKKQRRGKKIEKMTIVTDKYFHHQSDRHHRQESAPPPAEKAPRAQGETGSKMAKGPAIASQKAEKASSNLDLPSYQITRRKRRTAPERGPAPLSARKAIRGTNVDRRKAPKRLRLENIRLP